jgi:hypothetical protein
MSLLPQSNALTEASGDSIAELLSRDPEGYTRQDRDRVIEAFRAQRVKWQASEAAGAKAPRQAKGIATLESSQKAEDLGL